MEAFTSLWWVLLTVVLMGGVGTAASLGGVLALRRSSDTVVRVLGGVGIVLGVLLVMYAILFLFGAAVQIV